MKRLLTLFSLLLLAACASAATVVPPNNNLSWTNPSVLDDGVTPLTDLVSVTHVCNGVTFTVPTTTPGAAMLEPMPAGFLALVGPVTCESTATSASGGTSLQATPSSFWCDGTNCYSVEPVYCTGGACYDAIPPNPPTGVGPSSDAGGESAGGASAPLWAQGVAVLDSVVLAGTAISNVLPRDEPLANPNYPGTAPWRANSGEAAITGAWNGAAIDRAGDCMWITGGGHQDYASFHWTKLCYGTDAPTVELWDYPTVDVNTAGATVDQYSDGTPRPPHNYANLEFHPPTGAIIYSQGNVPYPGAGPVNVNFWEFDTTNANPDLAARHVQAWTRTDTVSALPSTPKGGQAYNPRDGWIYSTHASGPPAGLGRYDPVTDTFEVLVSTYGPSVWTGTAPVPAIVDSYGSAGLMVIERSNGSLPLLIDLGTLASADMPSLVDANSILTGGFAPLTYDPVNHALWTWKGGNQVGKLPVPADPFNDSWVVEYLTVGGAGLPLNPEPAGTYTRMRYDTLADGSGWLILVNKYNEDARAVRVH